MINRFLFLFFITLCVNAQAINIKSWTTNNGAKVLFMETHALKMVDIRVVFDAGSARDGIKFGLAKLTNSLIPTGNKNLNEEQISLIFENNGAVFSNDSLRDMSIFTLRSLSEKTVLNATVTNLANIILNPNFPQKTFDREQSTTLQAINMAKQSPSHLANNAFMKAIYGSHPYANPINGTIKTINKITPADLINFHKKYFVGNNAHLVIVGDLNMAEVKSLANQIIGKLPAGKKPEALPPVKKLSKGIETKINFPSQQTHVLIGQPGINRNDANYFPLYLGNHILGGSSLVSKLSTEVREKNGLVYSIYSYFLPMKVAGSFQINTQTQSIQKTLQITKKILLDFVENGVSATELNAAKKNLTGSFPLRIDSNRKTAEYLTVIGFYDLPLDYLDTLLDKINKVSVEDIKKAWQSRIYLDKMATVLVGKIKATK